jgi:hypothetical protein
VHPIRFVKDHPLATVVLLATGYGCARYGIVANLPFFHSKVVVGEETG